MRIVSPPSMANVPGPVFLEIPLDLLMNYADDTAPAAIELNSALDRLIGEVERELGGKLADLDRAGKQRAVRMFKERGAFTLRKSVATVAEALGVTRFTVYNYLNRDTG